MLHSPVFQLFPQGIEGVVAKEIELYTTGLVKVSGCFWRARLYEPNCQTRLCLDQPILAIGQQGNVLFVIPHHCLLWDRCIDEFYRYLSQTEITVMQGYERCWRT